MFKDYKKILKNLRDMQDQLWKDSMASFPGSASPGDLNEWQRKTFDNVNSWAGQAIGQSLELQQEWLDQWSERASGKKLNPKSFAELSAEASNSTQRWLDNQMRLRDQWLKVLRESGGPGNLPDFGEWEKAVQESTQRQMTLLNDWSEMADLKKLSAKEITKLSNQIVKAMQKSIETQQQLWSHWFSELGAPEATGDAARKVAGAGSKKEKKKIAADAKEASVGSAQQSDDLQQISGIGAGLEKKLKQNGISTLRQIAELSDHEITQLEEKIIRFSGRIKREKWVEQARGLLAGN